MSGAPKPEDHVLGSVKPNDPNAPGTQGWAEMPAAARAAACLAALRGGLAPPFDVEQYRWNPRTRVAFALKPDTIAGPHGPVQLRGPATVENPDGQWLGKVAMELVDRGGRDERLVFLVIIHAIRAGWGHTASEVEKLVMKKRR